MSGPKEFRDKYYGRYPTLKEYREYLQYKLDETKEFDCGCDYDMAMFRLQGYVNSWPLPPEGV